MDVWLHGFSFPGRVAPLARAAERWGFTGLAIADSQNLTADIWVELALAGAATSRLRLGPGVTNPVTRHIAVTASAALTLNAETDGRVTMGFAQGDSALSQIGRRALPVAEFERGLTTLQSLLRGDEVELDVGTRTSIRWKDGARPKVPVHVAATGPRTIAAAARHADGVDLTVGAELERLRWGARIVREAGPGDQVIGAYVNVAVDDDAARARALVRGSVATFARFAASSHPAGGISERARHDIAQLSAHYEKEHHGEATAGFAQQLDDEFVDRFAVAGPPETVRRRLSEIVACGIERLIIVPGSLDSDPGTVSGSVERFAEDVLPALS
jgi:5,10-methylenetetrahydromethanopterin reductase